MSTEDDELHAAAGELTAYRGILTGRSEGGNFIAEAWSCSHRHEEYGEAEQCAARELKRRSLRSDYARKYCEAAPIAGAGEALPQLDELWSQAERHLGPWLSADGLELACRYMMDAWEIGHGPQEESCEDREVFPAARLELRTWLRDLTGRDTSPAQMLERLRGAGFASLNRLELHRWLLADAKAGLIKSTPGGWRWIPPEERMGKNVSPGHQAMRGILRKASPPGYPFGHIMGALRGHGWCPEREVVMGWLRADAEAGLVREPSGNPLASRLWMWRQEQPEVRT